MQEYEYLLKHCSTEKQEKTIRLLIEGRSQAQAAQVLGITPGTVQQTVRNLRRKAARQGDSPEHDYTRPVPDGFLCKGVSTLYGKDGNVSAQWVKSQIDPQHFEDMKAAILEGVRGEVDPIAPMSPPEEFDEMMVDLYPITDVHLGMLSWEPETGENWDLAIGEAMLASGLERLIPRSNGSEFAVLAVLGDFLHWDQAASPVTPSSGHVLDSDGRFHKVVSCAVRVLKRAVSMALASHSKVSLVFVEGNHDPTSSLWLPVVFEALLENEPRLEVVSSPSPFIAMRYGDVMLGFHHGHLKGLKGKNGAELALVFADMEEWMAKNRYIHTGHLHSKYVVEVPGCVLEQHQTLVAPDAYSHRGGWRSGRSISRISYNFSHGECQRQIVRPDMLLS